MTRMRLVRDKNSYCSEKDKNTAQVKKSTAEIEENRSFHSVLRLDRAVSDSVQLGKRDERLCETCTRERDFKRTQNGKKTLKSHREAR